jgi:hypothetical protein
MIGNGLKEFFRAGGSGYLEKIRRRFAEAETTHPTECTGDMVYKADRRRGLHHGREQLAFSALASRMKMRLCPGKRLVGLEQMDEGVHRGFLLRHRTG